MADPRFHYRSDSLTPRRVSVPTASKPFTTPAGTAPALTTKGSEVGCIGTQYLNLNSNGLGVYRTMRFVGYGNVDNMTNGVSVLVRVIPRFTGFNPSSYGGLFTLAGVFTTPYFFLRALTDGRFQFVGVNSDFSQIFNLLSVSTVSFTSGTAKDIVVTWTGGSGSNGVKIYVDGTLLVQGTSSAASTFTDAKGQLLETIMPCVAQPQSELGGFDLNEMAVWGEVIDPTSGGLNLNGSSRSSFLTSVANDALAVLPTAGQVKSGIAFGIDSALTGTLTSPAVGNVVSGIQYGAAGTEFTGTRTAAAPSNVKLGVQYGAGGTEFTGTLESTDPGIANVLAPTAYKIESVSKVGTYTPPPESTDPGQSNVKIGVEYEYIGVQKTGTYTGSDRWSDPGPENVLVDTEYMVNGEDAVGTFEPLEYHPTMRAFLNDILRSIETTTLTDEEFSSVTVTEQEYTAELYEELLAILDARETVSNTRDRLTAYFESRNVEVTEATAGETNIFVGEVL